MWSAEKIGVGASAVAERRQQFINIFRKEIYSLGVGTIQTQQMNKFTRRKLAKTVAASEELQKGSNNLTSSIGMLAVSGMNV